MPWHITLKEPEPKPASSQNQPDKNRFFRGTLDERVAEIDEYEYQVGDLAIVTLPKNYRMSRLRIYGSALELLQRFYKRFGYQIMSYRKLDENLRGSDGVNEFRLKLSSLWGHGFLIKYAASYWNTPAGQGRPGKILKVGRYARVHYRINSETYRA